VSQRVNQGSAAPLGPDIAMSLELSERLSKRIRKPDDHIDRQNSNWACYSLLALQKAKAVNGGPDIIN